MDKKKQQPLKKIVFRKIIYKGKDALIPLKKNLRDSHEIYDQKFLSKTRTQNLPMILDPRNLSLWTIKTICKENQILLGSLWGISVEKSIKDLFLNFDNKLSLVECVKIYLDNHTVLNTEGTYRKGFKYIFDAGILSLKTSLNDFIDQDHAVTFRKIKESYSDRLGKKQAATSALLAFINYLEKQLEINIQTGNEKKDADRDLREQISLPMNICEWELFINALRSFNPRDALIAEVLQLANGPIYACAQRDSTEFDERNLISLETILKMLTSQVHFKKHWLQFETFNNGLRVNHCYLFPIHIFQYIKPIMKAGNPLIFTTSSGAPLQANQFKRSFERASEKAGLSRKITVTVVRIPIPELLYCSHCDKPRWNEQCQCLE